MNETWWDMKYERRRKKRDKRRIEEKLSNRCKLCYRCDNSQLPSRWWGIDQRANRAALDDTATPSPRDRPSSYIGPGTSVSWIGRSDARASSADFADSAVTSYIVPIWTWHQLFSPRGSAIARSVPIPRRSHSLESKWANKLNSSLSRELIKQISALFAIEKRALIS